MNMTLGRLVSRTIVAIALFSLWKVIFFGYFNTENWALLVFFYVIAALVAIAVVRRLGVLNYLENFLVLIVWLVAALIVDWIVVGRILDDQVWSDGHFWISYLVIILAALIFHKKRHVEIRHGRYSD